MDLRPLPVVYTKCPGTSTNQIIPFALATRTILVGSLLNHITAITVVSITSLILTDNIMPDVF